MNDQHQKRSTIYRPRRAMRPSLTQPQLADQDRRVWYGRPVSDMQWQAEQARRIQAHQQRVEADLARLEGRTP